MSRKRGAGNERGRLAARRLGGDLVNWDVCTRCTAGSLAGFPWTASRCAVFEDHGSLVPFFFMLLLLLLL